MSRLLRKRLPLVKENSEEKTEKRKSNNALPTDSKKNLRAVASKQLTKVKTTRASKKIQEQDENIVPQTKKSHETEKIKTNNRLLGLKSQIFKQDPKNKKATLQDKSPVFRDRTNESLHPTKVDSPLNVLVPSLAKQKSAKTKPPQNDVPLDKESKLRSEKVDNLLEVAKSPDESNSKERELSEQKESKATERVLRTRSGKLSTGKDNSNDTGEGKKSIKGNENIKDNAVEENKEDVCKEKNEKNVAPKQKKFFTLSIKERTRKRNVIKKPILDESSFSLSIIPEEITPSAKKTLRPRQNIKNYCEKSKLLLTPTKRNSKVVLEKIPTPTAKKVPIWKTIKFPETKSVNKDVYDISDSDLSFEENPKKRKKGIKKKQPPKRLKKTAKYFQSNKNKSPKVKKTANQVPKVEKEKLIPQVEIKPQQEECTTELAPSQPNSQIHPKPKLVSVEILDKKSKVSFVPLAAAPQPAKEFRPFRVTQNFRAMSIMQPNMADHSLLSKTMSPIAKVAENVDFSTPWRLPPMGNFSRVYNLVQSTPQIRTCGSLVRKTLLEKTEEKKIDEVEIESQPEFSDNTPVNLKPNESKLPEIPHVPSPADGSLQTSFSDDKENAAPNIQSDISPRNSPRNSPSKSTLGTPVFEPQPGPSGLQKQPLRELKILRQTNLNNFLSLDDAPERTEIRTPHGIFDDVHSTPINGKFLKKTSETDIENAFGFDDDVDASSSVMDRNEKPLSIPLKGILREKRENIRPRQKSQLKKPVRFSAKEVLRTLHARRIKKEESNNVEGKQISEENDKRKENVIEEPVRETTKKDQENETTATTIATDFSDTFDLLQEQTNETNDDDDKQDTSTLPLFADLEPPVHFATPPKSTYKRKRNMKYNFSEESDEDENKNEEKGKTTKKTKKFKKEDKKLNDWAKSINKTFEEIDNFDLVVE